MPRSEKLCFGFRRSRGVFFEFFRAGGLLGMRAATVVALLIQKNSHTSTRLLGAFKTRRKNGRNSNLNDDHHQSHKHRTVACALFILDCLLNCAVALQLLVFSCGKGRTTNVMMMMMKMVVVVVACRRWVHGQ